MLAEPAQAAEPAEPAQAVEPAEAALLDGHEAVMPVVPAVLADYEPALLTAPVGQICSGLQQQQMCFACSMHTTSISPDVQAKQW